MKKEGLFVLILLGVFLFNFGGVFAININNCGALNVANSYYQLNASISNDSLSSDCLRILAQNITLDCSGYFIASIQNYSAIYSNQYNTTIKNCNVSTGIGALGTNTNAIGIELLAGANNSLLYNNTASADPGYGISLSSISDSNLTLNSGISNSSYGLRIEGSSNNTFYLNRGVSRSNTGIYISSSFNNTFFSNNGISNSGSGFFLSSSYFNILNFNNGTSNSSYGLAFSNSNSNSLASNMGVSNSKMGIYLASSFNNSLSSDIGTSNSSYGIYLSSSGNNVLFKPTAIGTLSGSYGVVFSSSNDTLMQDCINISGIVADVLYVAPLSKNNTFLNCSYSLNKETIIAGSELIRKWYYQARVTDVLGNPIFNATIQAHNISGDLIFSNILTNESGWTRIINLIDYVNFAGNRGYYSNYFLNATNLTLNASHVYNVTLKLNNLNDSFALGEVIHIPSPPGPITNLQNISKGTTWIYWNWTNPLDSDFNSSIIYLNSINVANTSNNYYNATGLSEDTNYMLVIQTKNNYGDINSTNVSNTVKTSSVWPHICESNTYYIDYQNGSDSNYGKCMDSPWKLNPYMRNFSGNYTHHAGDRFIFRGGVVWPNEVLPLIPLQGGSLVNGSDYYGFDETWYVGTNWTQPIFNAQGKLISGFNSFFYNQYARNYITFDNFELINYYWNGTTAMSMVGLNSGTNILIKRNTIHNWSHGPLPTTNDVCSVIKGTIGSVGQEAAYNNITGPSTEYSCQVIRTMQSGHDNIISNSITAFLDVEQIYNNTIINSGPSWDGIVHCNSIETFHVASIYNNHIDQNQFGCPLIYLALGTGSPAGNFYVYNNLVTNNHHSVAMEIDTGKLAVASSNYSIYSNSIQAGAANRGATPAVASCVSVDSGGYSPLTLTIQNNHCISKQTSGPAWCYNRTGCGNVTTIINDHNLITPNSTGYDDNYYPLSFMAATIDAGTNSSSTLFSKDYLGVSRPQGNSWDIGAYESNYFYDSSYPSFSNYQDNNATLTNSGIGLFNVTPASTNGTVWMEINNVNITATNLTSHVYNVSYNFANGGSYNYRWYAYGNGTNYLLNISSLRNYLIYTDLTGPGITILSPSSGSYRNNLTIFQISTNENTSWCGYSLNGNSNVTMNKINVSYFNYSTVLADDLYNLVFSCNDSYNNFASASLSFAIDTLLPSISLNSPLTRTYLNSSLVSFNYTPIGGNGLSTCQLWGNWTGGWAMNKSNSTLVDDNSSRIFLVNLSSGTYKWNVWCNSSLGSGDWSAQGNQTFTVDLISPNATILLPLNDTLTNQTSINFTLNTSDNFGLVNATLYIVNATNNVVNQTTLSYGAGIVQTTVGVVVNLVDGVYNWFWNVFDMAGNMFSTQVNGNKSITADLTAPSVNIVSPISNYYDNQTILVNISVSDIRTDKIWFNYNGTDVVYTNPIIVNFSEGENTLNVYANDSAGNMASGSVSFNVDTVFPVVNLITRQNKVSQNKNITLYYNVTDSSNIINCSLYFDEILNQTELSINKNIAQVFYLTDIAKGKHNYSLICFDSAGNYNSLVNSTFIIFDAINFDGETTDLDNINLSNITNFILENSLYGQINFTNFIDLSNGSDFDNNINISFNRIAINSSALPELNVSARLSLYNLNFVVPKILKDGVVCSYCNIENYSSGILTFNVSGFSEYTSVEQCSDGIQNGDETSVDCGGSCSACSSNDGGNTGSGGGGSSNDFWIVTYPALSDNQFSVNGYSKELIVKSRVGFRVANETHYIGIISTNTSLKTATLNVSSTPQQKIMVVGEEWKVNVNEDNYYDLIVKLNSVSSIKANITITKINEVISPHSTNNSAVTNETLTTQTTPETTEENSSSLLVYCLGGLIIGAFVIWGIVYLKAKLRERKIRKSIRYYDKK